MRIRPLLIAPFALAICGVGCNDEFNPVHEYRDRLVVFSVLDNATDTQFVRLYSTYNAPGHNTGNQRFDTPVLGARVRVSAGGTQWAFRETTTTRWSSLRYSTPVHVYYAAGFLPRAGYEHVLTIQSSVGNVEARTTVPLAAQPFSQDIGPINNPFGVGPENSITLRAAVSTKTFATLFRFFLDYDRVIPGGWRRETTEVPLAFVSTESLERSVGVYPVFGRTGFLGTRNEGGPTVPIIGKFSTIPYTQLVTLYRETYGPQGQLIFRAARFVLYQSDVHFYNYTNLVNGFNDQHTVRTDLPDYSNISGGYGLFASVRRDSVVFPLSGTF